VAYSPGDYRRSRQPNSENGRLRGLFAAVTVLGLAAYGVSFGPIGDDGAIGWYVRFAVLAGLVAAFGLLPRGKPLPTLTAVLAAMGFLDALSTAVSTDARWALTVIVVLNALQAAAAVAALLWGTETESGDTAGYEAYVEYYNQAVRNYYSQQAGMSSHEQTQRGYGQATANAQAAAQAHRTQRPSQYADYAELDHTGSRGPATQEHNSGDAVPGRPAGLPSFGQAQTYADQPRGNTGESAPPSSPA
jgi:Family of unknown function (DUF5336)